MASISPVHSPLRATALACRGSKPPRLSTSRVTSMASSAAGLCFSPDTSSWDALGCVRSTWTSESSRARSWSGQAAASSTSVSISLQNWSDSPLRSSSLFRKCQYSAIGVTPSSWASRRMVSASRPSASARAMARPTTAALLSRGRCGSADGAGAAVAKASGASGLWGARWRGVRGRCRSHHLTTIRRTSHPVSMTCTTYRNDVRERRTGSTYRSVVPGGEGPCPDAGGHWWRSAWPPS